MAQVRRLGPGSKGRQPSGVVLHSSREPGELRQRLLSSDVSTINIVFIVFFAAAWRNNTHDTRSKNRCQKSTPFSGDGFRRRFFVPHTSGMKISGAKINMTVSYVNDE